MNQSQRPSRRAPPLPRPVLCQSFNRAGHVHGPDCNHGHSHGHHGHDHSHEHMIPTGSWTWAGVFFGLALHSLIDGLALGAAIQAESKAGHGAVFAGIGYFLAVFLHKPFDSISITSLMHMTGWSRSSCNRVNWIYAFVAPLGVLILFLTSGQVTQHPGWVECSLLLLVRASASLRAICSRGSISQPSSDPSFGRIDSGIGNGLWDWFTSNNKATTITTQVQHLLVIAMTAIHTKQRNGSLRFGVDAKE